MATDEMCRELGSVQAALLAQSSIQVKLIERLVESGLLSKHEVHELLDESLAMLENLQLEMPASEHWIYELARGHVEATLPSIGASQS